MSTFIRLDATILGGSVDNTPIGSSTPSTGFFTNLSADGVTNLDQTNIDTTDGSFVVSGTNPVTISTSGPSSWNTTSGDLDISSATSDVVVTASSGQFLIDNTQTVVNDTTSSSSTITGALVVSGGVGIGENLYIGGNTNITGDLYVGGTTTSVNSTVVDIADNTLILNSGPSSTADAGVMFHRYQTENDSGSNDVVNGLSADETGTSGTITATSIVLTNATSTTAGYYIDWWVRITSGLGVNQVRQITAYTGASRVATVNTAWTTNPSPGDTYSIYGCNYATVLWDEDADEIRFIATERDATNLNIVRYLDLQANDVTVNNLSVGGTISGASFSNLYTNDLDTVPPGPSGPLYIGQVNANGIIIGHTGITTQIDSILQANEDVLPDVTGTNDLGSTTLRWADIWFSGSITGGTYNTNHVYPNADNTYDLGSAALSYRNVYSDGSFIGATYDTPNALDTMNIGTTNAGLINISRTNQTTIVQGDLQVNGQFSLVGAFAWSAETITVPASAAGSPTLSKTISYIDVVGTPGFPSTGVMPTPSTDNTFKIIVCIGHVDDYVLSFGSALVDAAGNNTATMKLRFLSVGQSVQLLWKSSTAKYYIVGGSGCNVLLV